MARIESERLRAADLEAKGGWAEALTIYEELHRQYCSPRDLWPIALLQQRLGRGDDALATLGRYRERFPKDSKPPGRAEEEALLERVLKARQAPGPAPTGAPGLPPAPTGAPGLPPAPTGAPGLPPAPTGAPGLTPAPAGTPAVACPAPDVHEPKLKRDDSVIDAERVRVAELEGRGDLEGALALQLSVYAEFKSPRDLWPSAVLAYLTGRPRLALQRLQRFRSDFPPPKPPGRAQEEALLEAMIQAELKRPGAPQSDADLPCPAPAAHQVVVEKLPQPDGGGGTGDRHPQPGPGPDPGAAQERSLRLRRILGGVALGLGGVGLLTGAVTWGLREQAVKAYNDDSVDGCLDAAGHTRDMTCGDKLRYADSLQPAAIAGMVLGGAFAVTGAVLIGTSYAKGRTERHAWRLSPGPGLAGVSLDMSF